MTAKRERLPGAHWRGKLGLGLFYVFLAWDLLSRATHLSQNSAVSDGACALPFLRYPGALLASGRLEHFVAETCGAADTTPAFPVIVVLVKLSITVLVCCVGLASSFKALTASDETIRKALNDGVVTYAHSPRSPSTLRTQWIKAVIGLVVIGIGANYLLFWRLSQAMATDSFHILVYSIACLYDVFIVMTLPFLYRYVISSFRPR